ncbi:MAG: hypothetical protein ABFC96_12665 [Thermoguttaceae bacterium]
MRRKVLQDIANTLCHVLVGWRFGDDYEKIAELPDGTLRFDLLTEQTRHSSGMLPQLSIAGELSAWFRHRLDVHHIPLSYIRVAEVDFVYSTDRIKTNRKKWISFDISCNSIVETDEKKYVASLAQRQVWHQRLTP